MAEIGDSGVNTSQSGVKNRPFCTPKIGNFGLSPVFGKFTLVCELSAVHTRQFMGDRPWHWKEPERFRV